MDIKTERHETYTEGPELSLADEFAIYPDERSKDFQLEYAYKREFAELGSQIGEKVIIDPLDPESKWFNHQKLMIRHFRQYDRVFNISEAGTGKTGMFLAPAEYFRRRFLEEGEEAPIRHAYIVVKNENLVRDIYNQILCRVPEYKETTSSLTAALKKIASFYTITTYHKFASKLVYEPKEQKLRSLKYIADTFRNTFLHIDEAHHVRIESEAVGAGIVSESIGGALRAAGGAGLREKKDPDREYKALLYVIDNAPGLKRMISTATPMYHSRSELVRVGNLALPSHLRLPEDTPDRQFTDQEVIERFNGIVTFVRQVNQSVGLLEVGNMLINIDGERRFLGESYVGKERDPPGGLPHVSKEPDNRSRLLMASVMQGIQLKTYMSWLGGNITGPGPISREISLMVFPNGRFAGSLDDEKGRKNLESGLPAYVNREKDSTEYKETKLFDDWLPQTAPLDFKMAKVAECSAIYHRVLSLIEEHNRLKSEGKAFGTIFIFSHFLNAGGAIIFSKLLERVLGYKQYLGDSSHASDEGTSVCGAQASDTMLPSSERGVPTALSDTDEEKLILDSLTPAPEPRDPSERREEKRQGPAKGRYYSLLPRGSSLRFNNILKLMNSEKNWNGDYLHIVIGTPQAGIGINVANATIFMSVTVDPNDKSTYQAVNRIMRATSFDAILKYSGQKEIKASVYYHVAVTPEDLTYQPPTTSDPGRSDPEQREQSENVKTHRSAMQESLKMEATLNVLKGIAFDAHIHARRNAPAYPLMTPSPGDKLGQDTSTYRVFYANQEIDIVCGKLLDILGRQFTIELDQILILFPKINRTILERALEKLCTLQVVDSLGNSSRVYEDGKAYFLSHQASRTDAKLSDLNYVNAVSARTETELVDWTSLKVKELNEAKINKLRAPDVRDIDIEIAGRQLFNTRIKAEIVEGGIIDLIQGKTLDPLQKWIFNKYGIYIHRIESSGMPGGTIYAHRMYYLERPKTRQGNATRITKYDRGFRSRLLEVQERVIEGKSQLMVGTWRDMNKYDKDVKVLIQRDIKNQLYHFKQYDYVGTDFEGTFRLHEWKDRDKLKLGAGRIITNVDVKQLYLVLITLQVPPQTQFGAPGYIVTETPRPLTPYEYAQKTGALRGLLPVRVIQDIESQYIVGNPAPLFTFVNLTNTRVNTKAVLIELTQRYLGIRDRVIRRVTNADWYVR